jgi:hypothetical protein
VNQQVRAPTADHEHHGADVGACLAIGDRLAAEQHRAGARNIAGRESSPNRTVLEIACPAAQSSPTSVQGFDRRKHSPDKFSDDTKDVVGRSLRPLAGRVIARRYTDGKSGTASLFWPNFADHHMGVGCRVAWAGG